jgi:hypothetical protein
MLPDPLMIGTTVTMSAEAEDAAPAVIAVTAAIAVSDFRILDFRTLPPKPLFRGATLRRYGRVRKGLQAPTFV